jgi:hypothetical protein
VHILIDRKSSNQWPNATSQTPRKKKNKQNSSQAGEITKIRAKINEIETNKQKKTIQGNKKPVLWRNKQDWQTPGKSD